MNGQIVILLALVCAVATLAYSGLLSLGILKLPAGNAKMQEVAAAIQEGANAYLGRQTRTLAIVGAIIFVAIWAGLDGFRFPYIALCFAVGAIFSATAGYIGMFISVRANVRTAQAAETGLNHALDTSFKGGAVTGLAVVGLGMLGIAAFYLLYVSWLGVSLEQYLKYIIGYGFGGSLISLFARVGGGIYTKAADVGGDLVGKVIAGLPEDDPRNPACIADNVGDNVGDCAGMGADLFETYGVTLIAAMLLGFFAYRGNPELLTQAVFYPVALGAAAMVASIVATWFVKLPKGSRKIMGAMYQGTAVAAIVSAIAFYFITQTFFASNQLGIYLASLIGLAVMLLLTGITEYYTSTKFKPVKFVSEQSKTGPATNIISGLAVGMESTLAPILVICAGMLGAYWLVGGGPDNHLVGIYGIAIAATAMLSTCGIVVAIDSFGPITDNAGGIAEMAKLPPETRAITDALDAVGNTTKAVTKGYAIGSAGLAALVLFVCYTQEIDLHRSLHQQQPLVYLLSDPLVLAGLFIGGTLPFFFSSLFMNSVGKAASKVIEEVKRQFDEIPGIMEGTARPEYGRCVDIVTAAALKEMVLPGVLAILIPLVVGLTLGPLALGGLLVGAIVTGLLMAIFMTTAGATWDNAKKYVELGYFGGKGSDSHKAAVVGDTVGDPFKDTAGPALNPMIKILNIVALLIVSLIAGGSLWGL
ncbi:MAG: sodium-translocating pyrophosphatase [Candidatus Melainabacteria bacterium HGW-Melainabacteria-1]|nr:MAG: sodium-translocating pyrophosphatase [Candidatus Melainabacteria bacterium HGW-Melainabacteria-1]